MTVRLPMPDRAFPLVAAALLALVVAAACSSAPPSDEPPVPVVGVAWRATSVAGRVPQPGHEITLTLDATGQVSGSSGCNSYGGRYTIDAGRLRTLEIASTAAMCVDRVAAELERQFMGILGSGPFVAVEPGRLRLRGDAGEVVFAAP